MSILAGRRRPIDFTAPYLSVDQGVLLRRGLTPTPRSLAALKPLQICVQSGTTGASIVASRSRPAVRPCQGLPRRDLAVQDALDRGCDAVVFDAPILAALKAPRCPSASGRSPASSPPAEHYGVVLPEGSPLTPFVNTALGQLVAQGVVARLSQKWLATNLAQLPVLR